MTTEETLIKLHERIATLEARVDWLNQWLTNVFLDVRGLKHSVGYVSTIPDIPEPPEIKESVSVL